MTPRIETINRYGAYVFSQPGLARTGRNARIFVVDDKPVGYLTCHADGNVAEFEITLTGEIDPSYLCRFVAMASEHAIRQFHPLRLVTKPVFAEKVYRKNGFFPKGDLRQKIVEDWRFQVEDRAFDSEGFIINQGLMKKLPFGWFDTKAKGCGWIAAFNLLKMNGMETGMQVCAEELQKKAFLGEVMGQGLFMELYWLRKRNLKARHLIADKERIARKMEKSDSGILLYSHARGAHYVAFRKLGNQRFQFFNAIYGMQSHVTSAEEFLKQYCLFPVCCLIYMAGE